MDVKIQFLTVNAILTEANGNNKIDTWPATHFLLRNVCRLPDSKWWAFKPTDRGSSFKYYLSGYHYTCAFCGDITSSFLILNTPITELCLVFKVKLRKKSYKLEQNMNDILCLGGLWEEASVCIPSDHHMTVFLRLK